MISIQTTLSTLQNHARTFTAAVNMYGPQIAAALNSREALPTGCTNTSALADLSLDELRQKFHELEGALDDLERHIWDYRERESPPRCSRNP